MKQREPVRFDRGLQDTSALSSRRPDDFDRFQDFDPDHGGGEARKGMVRLAKVSNALSILNFDGVDDRVNLPSHGSLLPLGTVFTVEILFVVDTIATEQTIVGPTGASAAGVKVVHNTSGNVVVTLTDSAAGTATLTFTSVAAGTLCALQIVRDGATVTGWLNGTTTTTTMSATNSLASGAWSLGTANGANWLDGAIMFLRLWSIARSTRCDLYRPSLNPRNRSILFEWVLTAGPQSDVIDRGCRCAHAQTAGSPSFNRTPLVDAAVVQGLGYRVKKDGTKEILIAAYGRHYAATVS